MLRSVSVFHWKGRHGSAFKCFKSIKHIQRIESLVCTSKKVQQMKNFYQESAPKASREGNSATLVSKAVRLAAAGRCEEALLSLSAGNSSAADVKNARAVCLMRLGRYDAAVKTLRSLVLQSGCTWMKADLPVIYRTNFATALLLANLPGGVRETLSGVKEKDHPSVLRLQNSLDVWQKRLSWWQPFNWKFGVAPAVPITIDFEPGDFFDPLSAVMTTPSNVAKPAYTETHHVA